MSFLENILIIETSKKFNAKFNMSRMLSPEPGSIPRYFKMFDTVALAPAPSCANNGPPTKVCAILTADDDALLICLKLDSNSLLSSADVGRFDAANIKLA